MSAAVHKSSSHGSYRSYTTGFIISIVLTLLAFYFVEQKVFEGWSLAISISILAVGQLLVQLLFFLHLGREEKPRWNLTAFLFMLLVIVIVVIGSLWIMHNLDYHHEAPSTDRQVMQDENIYRN
jgi:cytochrome o ubiquinol oxidase operon protein cyoD